MIFQNIPDIEATALAKQLASINADFSKSLNVTPTTPEQSKDKANRSSVAVASEVKENQAIQDLDDNISVQVL